MNCYSTLIRVKRKQLSVSLIRSLLNLFCVPTMCYLCARCSGGKKSESCLVCGLKGDEVLTVRPEGFSDIPDHSWGVWLGSVRKVPWEVWMWNYPAPTLRVVTAASWCQLTPVIKPVLESPPCSVGSGRADGGSPECALAVPPALHYFLHPLSELLPGKVRSHVVGAAPNRSWARSWEQKMRQRQCGGYILVRKWIFSNHHSPH